MNRKMVSDGLGCGLQKKLPKPLAKLIQPILFSVLGIAKIDQIYNGACDSELDSNFAEKLLHKSVMNIGINVSDSDLKKIPEEGPLIVLANHPFGAIDGIALLALLKRVRPDVKLMANYILGGIPKLKEHFFLVDPFGNSDSSRKSFGGIRDTLRWLKDGHVLGIFPAGEVASYDKDEKKITDKEWAEAVAMIIRSAKCSVQCVFFEGQNSRLFQFLGRIHPILRTLWLARECGRACNHDISLNISSTISAETCSGYREPKELMRFLKDQTYGLKTSPD